MPKIQNNRKDEIKSVFLTDYLFFFSVSFKFYFIFNKDCIFPKNLIFQLKKKKERDIEREIVY